ncbi:MAG: hypothetical protein D3906_07370 [Candidatus Electrothrix sp. AUS1_2]|nr:hypothetical protein [Candidatus Electrothrix sp. AUS1_2]
MPFENLLNISIKKDWIDYLSALLTPTVAIASLYIAVNANRREEARLRHELFERRYRQFKAVGNFVRSITIHNEMTKEDEILFLSEIAEMRFIFDEETADYVRENIWHLAAEIHALYETYNDKSPEEERNRNLEGQMELRGTLRNNLNFFENKTLKYMRLQQPGILKQLQLSITAFNESIKNK